MRYRRGTVCNQFRETGKCVWKNCKFDHVGDLGEYREQSNRRRGGYPQGTSSRSSRPNKPPQRDDFSDWRRHVPLDINESRPLGVRLEWFFQEGRRLVDVDPGSAQQVVSSLSQEGGLKRVRELIVRDYTSMSGGRKKAVFERQVLPFIEILIHADVLASLLLENAVGTIYTFIFGPGGQRAVELFSYIADVLESSTTDDIEADSESKCKAVTQLEATLLFLKQVIELNSTAIVCEPLKPVVSRFESTYRTLESSNQQPWLVGAHAHLENVRRRLDIGSALPGPTSSSRMDDLREAVGYVLPRDSPGGRHDNDNPDICQISIMPTLQEIQSPRNEYLPPRDHHQWHIAGISGLLDRQFRLLREDTVGQLRDAIHNEIVVRRDSHGGQKGLRTRVYQEVRLTKLEMDIFQGLRIQVVFQQPAAVQKLSSQKKREEWWELSKRLQSSALVFLTDKKDFAVFCIVSAPKNQPPRSARDEAPEGKEKGEEKRLWTDSKLAHTTLSLVDTDGTNVKSILSAYEARRSLTGLCLIELPGVLLPSFRPTLQALQHMTRQVTRLPFADILTAHAQVNIVPPSYARRPGFSFDLQCLMRDGSQLSLQPGKPFDIQRLHDQCDLDETQAEALVDSLQREVALIQGPPGTGKSFTGVSLVKALLANKKKAVLGPIICVCYTNHALDQFLEDILKKKITTQIVRIGSRSKSEALEPFILRNVAQKMNRTKYERSTYAVQLGKLESDMGHFESAVTELKRDSSSYKLVTFLKNTNYEHYRQLFDKDDQEWRKVGTGGATGLVRSWLREGQASHSQPRSIDELQDEHIDRMTLSERHNLYAYWLREIQEEAYARAAEAILSHAANKAKYDQVRNECDLRCLQSADVIGITTSGLAGNLDMLRRLRSKVLIAEEAGEVLEAHLLTALIPSIEHAILIGDHLQLRPQVQNYDLSSENLRGGEKYALDVSLFERLVDTKHNDAPQIPFSTLETQRRMHPSIADLIRNTLYPRLKDASSVSDYPQVLGMRRRLFWLDHQKLEAGASDNDALETSHWNSHEVKLVAALVMHLTNQGEYKSGDIAVLTPYLGQLQHLRAELQRYFTISVEERDQELLNQAGLSNAVGSQNKSLSKQNLLKSVRVATVDNFQGEEAKVIVISLVRSNKQRRCGFLRTSNRINVLLSRARHGMYIIGNAETSRHIPMWNEVITMFQEADNFGPALELQCPRHPDTHISVSDPDDFSQFSPEGGCNLRCINRLKCGHPCVQKCHSETLHDAVHCLEPCPRPLKGCDHPCPKRCGDKCPEQCRAKVHDPDRVLPCGHLAPTLPCWQAQDLSKVLCPVIVNKTVPGCNHQVAEQCWIDVSTVKYKCKKQCRSDLACGHVCKRLCHQCVSRDNTGNLQTDHGPCKQQCGRNHTTCSHICRTPCHGEIPCPPCSQPCDVRCAHSKCSKKCHEPCVPCAEDECQSACPHSKCSMPCSAPCNHIPCSKRCDRTLECGHQCPSVCGEPCPAVKFCQVCGSEEVKATMVDFIMGESYGNIDLDQNPCIFPQCGHFLTTESMDGQMDLKKHYIMDENDKPIAIASSSEPFSIDDIKRCATCRGHLRDIARYGRLVRRALLDECTKKFILFSNNEYITKADALSKVLKVLPEKEESKSKLRNECIRIEGSRDSQIMKLAKWMPARWAESLLLRKQMVQYLETVSRDEQPFQKVRNKVEDVRRRRRTNVYFEFDDSVLQTKGALMATALLIRLDNALIADFLTHHRKSIQKGDTSVKLRVDLTKNKEDCNDLIQSAEASLRVSLQVEGLVFLAQLCALERPSTEDETITKNLLEQGMHAIERARNLCVSSPGQTVGLLEEVEEAEKMLNQGTFYTAVTNAERMEVIKAMAHEFRGTGHWYYCVNGHPFTIGECGMPMQRSRCPECGAPVGGQSHQAVEGVQRADDIEAGLRELHF